MISRLKVVAALLLLPLLVLAIPFSIGPLLTALVYATNESLFHYTRRRRHQRGRPTAGESIGPLTYRSAPRPPPPPERATALGLAAAMSCSFFGLILLTGFDLCFPRLFSSTGPFLVGPLMVLTWQTFTLGRALALGEPPGRWRLLFVGFATLAMGTWALVSFLDAVPVDDLARFFSRGPKIVLAEPFAAVLALHACFVLYVASRRAKVRLRSGAGEAQMTPSP